MKLKLPLIVSEKTEAIKKIGIVKEYTDNTRLFYALKDISQKHPYYFIEVETTPYSVFVDTLGRWLWGFSFREKSMKIWGAVKLEKKQEGIAILIPDFTPEQGIYLLKWSIEKLKEKRSKNENNS